MPEREELHIQETTSFKSHNILYCTDNAVLYPHVLAVGCQDLLKPWPSLALTLIRAILNPSYAAFWIAEDPAARSFNLIKLPLARKPDADDHSLTHAVKA